MPRFAKSTLTLATIEKVPNRWIGLAGPIGNGSLAGEDLNCFGASNFKVSSGGSGMVFLDGLVCQGSSAHISITGNDQGEWTYFHLTLVGAAGKCAYFALEYDDGEELIVATTSHTLIGKKKESVSKSKNFWAGVPPEVANELGVIMRAFLKKEHASGEAI
jgi:hypothetical protein